MNECIQSYFVQFRLLYLRRFAVVFPAESKHLSNLCLHNYLYVLSEIVLIINIPFKNVYEESKLRLLKHGYSLE